MSYFTDWRIHYDAGCLAGIGMKFLTAKKQKAALTSLDRWAYERELEQKKKSKTPNDPMSAHQLKEAMAWGAGARAVLGRPAFLYPSPPYPENTRWT